jgi:protein transport protein SEC61 subunit gamma-like protein
MGKLFSQTKPFYHKCKRVWHVLKKPTKKEYGMIAKISAFGIAVIGALGFIISWIMEIFK